MVLAQILMTSKSSKFKIIIINLKTVMAVSMQGISYNPLRCCLSVTVSTTNPSAARDTLYDWLNDLALLPEVKGHEGS